MKTNFNISQDEKNRILEMHENRTKKLYLGEQAPPVTSDLPGTPQYQKQVTNTQQQTTTPKPV